MEEVLIKNGNVLLFENNDVVIKKINVFIKNGKIEKIFLDDEKSKIYEEYNISVSEGKDNNLKNLSRELLNIFEIIEKENNE